MSTTRGDSKIIDFDGPLAEFSALRDEIQERVKSQQHLFSLQLTLASAVFGFSLSRPNMIALLLIVPFSSYLLCGRVVAHHFGTLRVAKYIKEELSPRTPGGLHWESWLDRQQGRPHMLGSTLPLLLTFVGAGALALAWVSGYVFAGGNVAVLARCGLVAIWLSGLVTTGLSAVLVLQMSGRLPVRGWNQTGLS
ncbi:hypothetical protein [Saccharothrix syringae]|uniref:Uncharacterized protein n=1 Tax=Saccharothrix syringae TaxID=103733 RepID=A0A5Q0GXW3_SACSY|nr:hypothetical protein [Saccharothrix syringae]QFZ18753.1 hypothetical protein EKG83_15995 [Saccharothrix syringae]